MDSSFGPDALGRCGQDAAYHGAECGKSKKRRAPRGTPSDSSGSASSSSSVASGRRHAGPQPFEGKHESPEDMRQIPRAEVCIFADLEIRSQNTHFSSAFAGHGSHACSSLAPCLVDSTPLRQWLLALQIDILTGSVGLPTVREFGLVQVRRHGAASPETMWLAVCLPSLPEELQGSRDQMLWDNYVATVRLLPPTSSRAVKALGKQGLSQGNPQPRLSAVVPTSSELLPGFLAEP